MATIKVRQNGPYLVEGDDVTVVDGAESSSLPRASQISTPAAMTIAATSATRAAVAHPDRPDGGGPTGPLP